MRYSKQIGTPKYQKYLKMPFGSLLLEHINLLPQLLDSVQTRSHRCSNRYNYYSDRIEKFGKHHIFFLGPNKNYTLNYIRLKKSDPVTKVIDIISPVLQWLSFCLLFSNSERTSFFHPPPLSLVSLSLFVSLFLKFKY